MVLDLTASPKDRFRRASVRAGTERPTGANEEEVIDAEAARAGQEQLPGKGLLPKTGRTGPWSSRLLGVLLVVPAARRAPFFPSTLITLAAMPCTAPVLYRV